VGQPIFNLARTCLTRGLSEPGLVQPIFKTNEIFSVQPSSNLWWAWFGHELEPLLASLPKAIEFSLHNPFIW